MLMLTFLRDLGLVSCGDRFRMILPIRAAVLRLDYGIPIQKAGNSGGGKFNFNVGYQF